jgi:hypothetical protein
MRSALPPAPVLRQRLTATGVPRQRAANTVA